MLFLNLWNLICGIAPSMEKKKAVNYSIYFFTGSSVFIEYLLGARLWVNKHQMLLILPSIHQDNRQLSPFPPLHGQAPKDICVHLVAVNPLGLMMKLKLLLSILISRPVWIAPLVRASSPYDKVVDLTPDHGKYKNKAMALLVWLNG